VSSQAKTENKVRAGDPKVLLALAQERHRSGQLVEAEVLYRELIGTWPEAAEPRHRLGILYAETGRASQAVDAIAAAVRLAPRNPLFLNHFGNACVAAGRHDEAVQAYRQAIALRPDYADAHFNLGNLLLRSGRRRDAVAAYREAVRINPGAVHVQINLGIALQGMAAYDEAIDALGQATAADPQSFEAHYNLGILLAEQRRFDEAVDAYRTALAINPDAPSAHLSLGIVRQQQNRPEDAIACYEKAALLAPELTQAHANLGAALYEKGDYSASLRAIKKALALDAADASLHVNLGQTLEELGDLSGADAAYRRALELERGHVSAQAFLSVLLPRLGKADEARLMLDFPTVLRTRRIERPEGWPTIAAFNDALARHIYDHPTLMRDPPRATKVGSQTMEILHGRDPTITALQRIIEDAVADYMANALPATRNPFAAPPPKSWRLHGWGVVLRSSGHQTPHFHPAGAVSGVYYVRIPEIVRSGQAGEAGFIRFGFRSAAAPGAENGGLSVSIRPEEGMLALFPSYLLHWTVPFTSTENRISIAFDAVPAAPV
jgi:uncharacterized protein (TIGR02466 family)